MLSILKQDSSRVFCVKPPGVLSQAAPGQEESMLSLLERQLGGPVWPVHRLDQAVGGVMVFARTQAAAGALSQAVARRLVQKEYLAVLRGRPAQAEGELRDLLYWDSARGKSFVVSRMRRGVKEASLSYRLLAEEGGLSLAHVLLHTGRSHQIRVQFASRGTPLLGDGRYGGGAGPVALWGWRLSCPGCEGVRPFAVSAAPEGALWSPFRQAIEALGAAAPPAGRPRP